MTIENQPTSTKSLQKELFKNSLVSPYVLYPTVTAVLGGMAGALFGFSGLVASIAVGGLFAAAGGFTTEFALRRDKNMKRIVSEINRQMEERRQAIVNDLKMEIAQQRLKSAEKQLNDFQSKFATFIDVLDDRFSPTELTFMRYSTVAEQVYLSGMDNLRNAVILQKASGMSDIEDLRKRLGGAKSAEENNEQALLKERITGYEKTRKEIDDLMLMNERALTMLDQVTQKIARTQVSEGMASGDTETAMNELGRLGAMLAQYAKR